MAKVRVVGAVLEHEDTTYSRKQLMIWRGDHVPKSKEIRNELSKPSSRILDETIELPGVSGRDRVIHREVYQTVTIQERRSKLPIVGRLLGWKNIGSIPLNEVIEEPLTK